MIREKPNLKLYRMYGEVWLFGISCSFDFRS
nr:MAG TPA: hypothetical protein [Caudoviricetes sp.]